MKADMFHTRPIIANTGNWKMILKGRSYICSVGVMKQQFFGGFWGITIDKRM